MDGYRPKMTGDGVRAERAENPGWWPHSDGTYAVVLRSAGLDCGDVAVWFRTEAAALAFIAQVNGVSVGGDVPSDPSTEGMLVLSGQWLIDNDPDGQTWERRINGFGWLRDHRDGIGPDRLYPVRRIVPPPAPPEPAVEEVPLADLPWEFRLADGAAGNGLIRNGEGWFYWSPGCARHEPLPINPDGTVTVLRDPSTSPASPATSQEQDS